MSKRTDGWRGRGLAWTAAALAVAAAGPCAAGPRVPAAPAPAVRVTMAVEGDRLTAHVAGASLRDTIEALAGALPLRVRVRGDIGGLRVWADLRGVEIEEGVRRLLRGTSYVLVHGEQAGAGRGRSRLIEVVVLGGTGKGGVGRLAGPGSMAATPAVTRGSDPGNPRPRRLDDDALSEMALHDPDQGRRVAALEALGRPGMSQKSLGPFTAALEDPEASVRLRALELLRDLDIAPPLPSLAWLTRADPSPAVRRTAVALLATVRGAGGRELALGLVADPDPEVSGLARRLVETPQSPIELTPNVVEALRQP